MDQPTIIEPSIAEDTLLNISGHLETPLHETNSARKKSKVVPIKRMSSSSHKKPLLGSASSSDLHMRKPLPTTSSPGISTRYVYGSPTTHEFHNPTGKQRTSPK